MDLHRIDAGSAQMYSNSGNEILLCSHCRRTTQRPPVMVVTQNLIESIKDRDATRFPVTYRAPMLGVHNRMHQHCRKRHAFAKSRKIRATHGNL